jgi:rhodanese-related sulfurtransferase
MKISKVKHLVVFAALLIPFAQRSNAWPVTAPMLLDMCAGNASKLGSWTLEGNIASVVVTRGEKERGAESFDLRSDGTRVSSRSHRSQGSDSNREVFDKRQGDYLSLLWDGKKYTKYYKPNAKDPGQVMIDDFSSAPARAKYIEVGALQYGHQACCLMGRSHNCFEGIVQILREANNVTLRAETERVNEVACYVIDAKTGYGDYTVWIDPEHGFSLAQWQVQMSKTPSHLWRDEIMPFDSFSQKAEVSHFEQVDGVWIGKQAVQTRKYVSKGTSFEETLHIKVTNFIPHPDHEALKSFVPDDIPEGTMTIVVPVTHIRYLWNSGGKLTLHFDEKVVARMDKVLAELKGEQGEDPGPAVEEGREDSSAAMDPDPNSETLSTAQEETSDLKPRPHCGLYCLYSVLKLSGQDVDFRDLVKPEYYGRLLGSSLAELNRGAKDYGLYAGVVSRLSTRALRDCPYWAILHVRRGAEAKEYDHYQLFLGTENGKAKLFNPPEGVKLVKFSDLAPLWDGYALFVSPRPLNVDAIFTADRQRLLQYAVIGCLILVAAHLGRRTWLAIAGHLSRRWTLGLTAGQAGLLAFAAVFCAGAYHFADDEGLLANAQATASFQKAYQGAFIPRISHQKAHELLGTGTIFIDARLAPDYERGHLEGALSIPVDANDAMLGARSSGLAKGARIVLYCQSAGCQFAERVGVRLLDEGFNDLVIFKGGWREWTQKYGVPDPNESERKRDEPSTN